MEVADEGASKNNGIGYIYFLSIRSNSVTTQSDPSTPFSEPLGHLHSLNIIYDMWYNAVPLTVKTQHQEVYSFI